MIRRPPVAGNANKTSPGMFSASFLIIKRTDAIRRNWAGDPVKFKGELFARKLAAAFCNYVTDSNLVTWCLKTGLRAIAESLNTLVRFQGNKCDMHEQCGAKSVFRFGKCQNPNDPLEKLKQSELIYNRDRDAWCGIWGMGSCWLNLAMWISLRKYKLLHWYIFTSYERENRLEPLVTTSHDTLSL